jgi:GNAT superfamily N-acetyltransferase
VIDRAGEPRLAIYADLPALRDIVKAAYSPYLARMDTRPAPMSHDLGPDVDAGAVWVLGKPPVGLICLVALDGALLIENVAVHPDAQGGGVGRRLMAVAEHEALRLGAGTVRLYTNEVMVENIAIYQHLGYRELYRRTEGGFRRVFMEKKLPAP